MFNFPLFDLGRIWIATVFCDELRVQIISESEADNNRDITALQLLDPLFSLISENSPTKVSRCAL